MVVPALRVRTRNLRSYSQLKTTYTGKIRRLNRCTNHLKQVPCPITDAHTELINRIEGLFHEALSEHQISNFIECLLINYGLSLFIRVCFLYFSFSYLFTFLVLIEFVLIYLTLFQYYLRYLLIF